MAKRQTPADAIDCIPCITATQVTSLKQVRIDPQKQDTIRTVDDLWYSVGADPFNGIDRVAAEANLAPAELRDLLTAIARHEAQNDEQQGWRHNWPEITIAVGLLVLVLLFLRAIGILALTSSGRLQNSVLVPVANINAAHVLRATDLRPARLAAWKNIFTSADNLDGFILIHAVPQGKPIRYEDVQHLEVTAVRDLPKGKVIAREDITVTWLAYDKDAVTQPEAVIEHKILFPLHKGSPILKGFVDPAISTAPQVVVRTKDGLRANHVIRVEEVDLKRLPLEPDGFLSLADVVGRRTREAIDNGAALHKRQLGEWTKHIAARKANRAPKPGK